MARESTPKDKDPQGTPPKDGKDGRQSEGTTPRPTRGDQRGVGSGRSQEARNAGAKPYTDTSARGAGGKRDRDR